MSRILTSIVFFFLFTGSISAQQINIDDFRFGLGAQYIFDGSTFGLQGKALVGFNDQFDLGGTFTLYLEDGTDYGVDLDFYYTLLEPGENFGFKPFAGLNVIRFSFGSVTDTDLHLNLGVLIDLFQEGNRNIYIEPKLILGGNSSFVVSAGTFF